MFSMRIDKQGIPIWFQSFKGISKNEFFEIDALKNTITQVSHLFQNRNLELIFLADR